MSKTVAPVQVEEEFPVASLQLWEQNPRRITKERFEALLRSMRDDPEMLKARPLIAMKDGRVIAGNMRLRGALELGWKTIPVVQVDLSEEKARAWALRDNNPYGEWDEDLLAQMLYEMTEAGEDTDLTGFAPDFIADMLSSVSGEDPPLRGTDLALSDVAIGNPEHEVKAGEVWTLGPHLLVCAGVYDGWPVWAGLLKEGALFVPYPTPTVPLTVKAETTPLVLVQPDPWMAGHLIDKYVAVKGTDGVGPL